MNTRRAKHVGLKVFCEAITVASDLVCPVTQRSGPIVHLQAKIPGLMSSGNRSYRNSSKLGRPTLGHTVGRRALIANRVRGFSRYAERRSSPIHTGMGVPREERTLSIDLNQTIGKTIHAGHPLRRSSIFRNAVRNPNFRREDKDPNLGRTHRQVERRSDWSMANYANGLVYLTRFESCGSRNV